MLPAITGSTTPPGRWARFNVASVSVIECARVKAVTTFTKSQSVVAPSIKALRNNR